MWEAVEAAGAVPYGVDIIEPIRVETGMIVTDYDYEPHRRSPYDLGLDRLVVLDAEGECMGADHLRAAAADPPNRFVTIRLAGTTLPEYGARVTVSGEEVGVLTSPATSPLLGPIGLAIVRTAVGECRHRGRRRDARREHGHRHRRRARDLRPDEGTSARMSAREAMTRRS